MIYNEDGTPYSLLGNPQQFDPEGAAHKLFNAWDREAIRIGGTPVDYFEVLIQTNTVDTTYMEDRGKFWCPVPVRLWCFYEPIPNQNAQGAFGIDAPDEMVFEFNYRDVLQKIGHPPLVGSLIYTPHKRERWQIKQRNDGEFKLWGQLRLQLICAKYQPSRTGAKSPQPDPEPDFKINDGPFLNQNRLDKEGLH